MGEPPGAASDGDGAQGEGQGQDGVQDQIHGRVEAQDVRRWVFEPPKDRGEQQTGFQRDDGENSEHIHFWCRAWRDCGSHSC